MGPNLDPESECPLWGLLHFSQANGRIAVTTPYLQPSHFVIHNNPAICSSEASLNNSRINEMFEDII